MKLMLSVGKGEKCMRLWNLVTGRKAGVLNFDRELLQSVKEGKYSKGEGQRIAWNAAGEEFAVAFEWGAVVFGIDSTPKCRVVPSPRSKIHQMKYVSRPTKGDEKDDLLAISTEDGRVIFYSTQELQEVEEDADSTIPHATPVAQIGGKQAGFPGRIKDFEVLSLEDQAKDLRDGVLVVAGNSDGVVRVWKTTSKDLTLSKKSKSSKEAQESIPQVGSVLSTYETGNRITCLAAFVMLPAEDPDTLIDSEDDEDEEPESSDESDDE
jgi:protein MAK11